MSDYLDRFPQHKKLDQVQDESQTLGLFLEVLSHQYTLCEYRELEKFFDEDGNLEGYTESGYYPIRKPIERILAEYYEIDYDELMREKDLMLEDIRAGVLQ